MSDFKAMYENRFWLAGALPQTPLGELIGFPRPSSWNKGDLLLTEGRDAGRGREGEVECVSLNFP